MVLREPFGAGLEILDECLSLGEFLPFRLAGACGTVRLGSEAGLTSGLNGTCKKKVESYLHSLNKFTLAEVVKGLMQIYSE